jgi:large subunit ribosomal protein L4e
MKAKKFTVEGKVNGEVSLPKQFSEEFRPDLIKKAVLAIQSHNRQAYGASPDAGTRASAYISKRRKAYKTTYGKGQSRTPRKVVLRRGLHFYFVGAFAPNTTGGRRAHPAKAEKDWNLKLNIKERRKAIRSAIAATMDQEKVKTRGHKSESVVIEAKYEDLKKTKEVETFFKSLGYQKELDRIAIKKVRAGKGKNRGRPYKKKKGPLLVVSKQCSLMKAAQNMQGIEICEVKNLNAELLAPGTDAGRLTVWSDKALELMEKEKLFY